MDISASYSASARMEKTEWIRDSGVSVHMTSVREWFTELKPLWQPLYMQIANDKRIAAAGTRIINIQALVEGQWINSFIYKSLRVSRQ